MAYSYQAKNTASHTNQSKNTASYAATTKTLSYLLLENGDYMLLENGDKIILEQFLSTSFGLQTKNTS